MGSNHIQSLTKFEGIEVVAFSGRIQSEAEAFAKKRKISHVSPDLETCLGQPRVEAILLATPNRTHTIQAELALNMSKNVQVEIPVNGPTGIVTQNLKFLSGISEDRKPLTSWLSCRPTMEVLDRLQKSIDCKK